MKKNLYFFLPVLFLLTTGFTELMAQQQRVTLSLTGSNIQTLFQELQKQTGFFFVYNEEQCKDFGEITVKAEGESLKQVLDRVFKDKPFSYHFEDEIIVVRKGAARSQNDHRVVRGQVTDPAGLPLPGVTVTVEKSLMGTATDQEGNYQLTIPNNEVVNLQFSFIGMKSRTERVGNRSRVDVVLEEDTQEMGEVVVTGLFERKKESFTGSAVTFKQEDLKLYGNQNIIASLKNLDPSFIVEESVDFGSDPNRIPEMRVRGTSSLKSDYEGDPNQPLFILNGFESTATQIFDLDMNRVSSVTILKDAAAKALYGSKAANGVVVVETMLPQQGRLRVSYNGNLNLEAPDLTSYDLTDAAEKLQVEVNAGRYTATSPTQQQFLTAQYNEIQKAVASGVDTYWLAKPLRVGVGHKHSLNLEGGDPAMRYGVDFSYNKVAGVMKKSDRETISGSINLSYRFNDIIFRNILSVTFNRADDSPYGSFSDYSRLNPYWTEYDDNGNMKKFLGTYQGSTSGTLNRYANPLYNATLGTKNFSKYTQITENFYAEWQVIQSLKVIGRFGFTYTSDTREDFYPGDHTRYYDWTGDNYFRRGSYSITDGVSKAFNADITANFTRMIGDHMILANAAWSLSTSSGNSHGMSAEGFMNNRVDDITFAAQYAENGTPSGSESISREIGITGAVNYSYKERYLADVSLRTNASSAFGSKNRWGTFWSLGLGWNVHNEAFFTNSSILNQLKLRGSIGYTGNQNFSSFQAMRTYQFYTDRTYDNTSGAYLMGMANDKLQWQQTRDINGGIDLRLFNRLNVRFDAYISTTDNLLVDYTIPTSTGFSSYKENLGEVENKGFDMTLSYLIYRNPSKDAFISINASTANNVNKIKKISEALRSSNEEADSSIGDLADYTTPLTRYEEGQSLTAIWAVKSLGIDPVNGEELFVKKDGTTTYLWDSQDQIVAGDSNPKFRGNFGVSSEYKGFGLAFSFRYSLGADYYNQSLVTRIENVDIAYNVDRRVLTDTWHQVGDQAAFKRITSAPKSTYFTTRFVEKKNELQLASLNVSYDFKHVGLKHIDRLKCSLYMNDVFTVSTVKAERGLSYPFSRSFSFSLTATF